MADTASAPQLYLGLLKRALTRIVFEDEAINPLAADGELLPFDPNLRADGRDWPAHAETMIGMRRLDQLQQAVETVLQDQVPGDLVETGVWRGGASILMRAVLAAYGDTSRTVWVADSFQGLPPPDPGKYPADTHSDLHTYSELAVTEHEVRDNFARYGLLDQHVRFLPGWFRDTLPAAPIDRLAVLRLDGDLYESTIVALEALYPKLQPGGFAIVDDYGAIPACRQAVDEYRHQHGIGEPLVEVDWTGVYWRRA